MKKILQQLFEHKTLTRPQAAELLVGIGQNQFNEHQITAFMTVYLMRSITIDELQGFREALLELSVPVNLNGIEAIDIVGTGGDGKDSFNISTLASFIVAGTGQKVAKHGNYGSSSVSGASDVMQHLGYRFKNSNDSILRELELANMSFLHAPAFHPALKIVAPLRKNLGIRTFFNMLGPLVNPAKPAFQLIGVYNLEMARLYNYLLQQQGRPFTIVHSLDGYDEVSLTGDTKIFTAGGEKIMTPEELGKRRVLPADIYGGNSVEQAAKIFTSIIRGDGTWAQNAVVLANAALALFSTEKFPAYEHAYQAAVESLESGSAHRSLKKLLEMQL
ncbi:MAG: anthranilate phosphoribosyltransferase [Ferruginibacter sp.]